MYQFFVSAGNGAGTSLPSRYLETLPISKYRYTCIVVWFVTCDVLSIQYEIYSPLSQSMTGKHDLGRTYDYIKAVSFPYQEG